MEDVETLIVGGGPAGLAMSFALSQRGLAHLVLERGRVGEHWRTRRWDSLHLVAPNWHLQLPGMPYDGDDPDGFLGRDAVVAYIERYAATIHAPLRSGVAVRAVEQAGEQFHVHSDAGMFRAHQLVIATGAYTTPRLPACSADLAPVIAQLHAADYRAPAQLAPGGVLVVGSGESGCQIAEELRRDGRTVVLAVGRAGWLPRRYRGRDSVAWLTVLGAFAQTVATLPGGDPRNVPPGPQFTGRDGGRDLNLHTLARDGVQLAGHLEGFTGAQAHFAADLHARIAEGDAGAASFCAAVDAYIDQHAIDAPAAAAPRYDQALAATRAPLALDLGAAGITTVLWATGYRPRYDWVRLPVFAADGYPLHTRGVTDVPGLYFLGLEWQHTAQSHVFQGLGADAAYLAEVIARRG